MNILMLTSEFAPATGGIGTYAKEVAAAAAGLGARVTVHAPDYGEDTSQIDAALPFEIRRFHGALHSMRNLPAKIALARRAVREQAYDIVHAADWPFFIPAALAMRSRSSRLLMTVHGTEINETQTALKRLAITSCGVFAGKTEIAANSAYTRSLFGKYFTVEPARLRAIPLGVSDFWLQGSDDRNTARARHQLDADRIVMITVARLTRRKGHDRTLAALLRVPPELRARITWLVVGPEGEPDYVNQFRALASQAGCDIRILGTLPRDEIRELYAAADFFCLTGIADDSGRVEGFGLVYLEAGAVGLPSVATAVGGVPDAVLADRSGLLVDCDVDAIAAAITAIASDPALRVRLGRGALDHACALSWTRCATETYWPGKQAEAREPLQREEMAHHLAPPLTRLQNQP
jgi:glycosyltransferase involved in cell wall biosynthesis